MYLLITLIVVLIVAVVLFTWAEFDYGDPVAAFFGTLFAGGFFLAIAGMVVSTIVTANIDEYEHVNTQERPLVAVSLGSETEGSFFLGSGYIDGELTYNYAVQEPSGGVRLKSIDADRVLVFEGSDDPMIKTIKTRTVYSPWSWDRTYNNETEIHVPEGSIVHTYNIDVSEE